MYNERIRFPSLNIYQNKYTSFNLGYVHYIVFDIEKILDTSNEFNSFLTWLEKDLENADQYNRRFSYPWIVVVSNQPIYRSHLNMYYYISPRNQKILTKLFQKHTVDLYISGG